MLFKNRGRAAARPVPRGGEEATWRGTEAQEERPRFLTSFGSVPCLRKAPDSPKEMPEICVFGRSSFLDRQKLESFGSLQDVERATLLVAPTPAPLDRYRSRDRGQRLGQSTAKG